MNNERWFIIEYFIGAFVFENARGRSIYDMNGMLSAKVPHGDGYVR